MKAKKTMIIALAAVLVAVASVAGTLAYMTSKTQTVTNTFTVGNIEITLDETDNTKTDGSRTEVGNTYSHMQPGDAFDKDPIVHVKKGSEECFVFVYVENGIDKALADYVKTLPEGTKASEWAAKYNIDIEKTWTAVEGHPGLYKYNETVNASDAEADIDLTVFSTVLINTALNNGETAALEGSTITVQAFAHQVKNTTEDAAQAAAIAALGL